MKSTTTPQTSTAWESVRAELVNFVNRRVEHINAAEDIVQDVFERLHKTGPQNIQNPQAWLFKAARNATIDHYRTRKLPVDFDERYNPTTPTLSHHAYPDGKSPAEQSTSEPNDATQELAKCLGPLVAELPKKYREALTLVDLEGHTQKKAAELENISVSGMKSRVQRGRSKLAENLKECCAITTDTQGSIVGYQPKKQC